MKADTAQAVIDLLAPLQARYRQLEGDPAVADHVVAAGAEKARSVASLTLARAKDAIGLLPASPLPAPAP